LHWIGGNDAKHRAGVGGGNIKHTESKGVLRLRGGKNNPKRSLQRGVKHKITLMSPQVVTEVEGDSEHSEERNKPENGGNNRAD